MQKLVNFMGPVFQAWASSYFQSEIDNQFEDFKKKNPEEGSKCNLENFKEKLLAYHTLNGNYINSKYFTKDISIIEGTTPKIPDTVKLTENLLKFIDQMQNDEWGGLDCYQKAISDAVCFMGTILYQLDDDEKEMSLKHIEALCLTREIMENLNG